MLSHYHQCDYALSLSLPLSLSLFCSPQAWKVHFCCALVYYWLIASYDDDVVCHTQTTTTTTITAHMLQLSYININANKWFVPSLCVVQPTKQKKTNVFLLTSGGALSQATNESLFHLFYATKFLCLPSRFD